LEYAGPVQTPRPCCRIVSQHARGPTHRTALTHPFRISRIGQKGRRGCGELPRAANSDRFGSIRPARVPTSPFPIHDGRMAPKPTGWNRIVAKLQGEVPATELEAFRRASASVLELLDQVERRRLECTIDGVDPWAVPGSMRAAFLCAWNAFVLQTLGNELLDADYRAEPRTPQFVPPVTAEQVLRWYEPVEGWVNRAWQAQASPDYHLDVAVPAPLPAWVEVDPLPPAHLDGLLYALRSVGHHADAAMAFLPATPLEDRPKQTRLNAIRQIYASAQARTRYAEDLAGHEPAPEVRERAGQHARGAIEQFYRLGQLIADPELAVDDKPAPAPPREPPAAPARLPPRAKPAGLELRTHHDRATNQTVTETAETIDFSGQLSGEVNFSVRLTQVRTPESRAIVLRVAARAEYAYPMVTAGTLTIHTNGQSTLLRTLPDRRRQMSPARPTLHEEFFGYALPDGLLQKLCSAADAGLRFKNYRGMVELDAATMARFQAYCRSFYEAVIQPG
jgi:hypothetical protein